MEPAPQASEQPEAVSLREIETMLSPGKIPPRLPATSARSVSTGPRAAPNPGALGARSVSMAPRAAAPRAAAPRSQRPPPPAPEGPPSTVERSIPNPLEASAADLELMAMLAAVPPKRPLDAKPAWAPPKAPTQAKASTVRVLSSEAVAALKGERTAPAGPLRSPTLRSTAVQVERPLPAPARKASISVPPPPPIRLSPPSAPDAVPGEVDDSAWDLPEEKAPPAREARPAVRRESAHAPEPTPTGGLAASNARAVDALQMRAGTRGSLPDPVELLRDAPDGRPAVKTTGRGSVVDPLELYGAITPHVPAAAPAPKPPEQSLPKVMVQVPAKGAATSPAGPWTGAAPGGPAARTAEALAAAEARAEKAAAEANAASFRPKVELPTRLEPRPLPKPPPREPRETKRADPKPAAATPPAEPRLAAPTFPKGPPPPPPKPELRARAAAATPSPAAPLSSEPVSAEPISVDPTAADDDEIEVDVTTDTPEPTDAGPSPSAGSPSPDSGRFDLQQLMSGRDAPKSSKKGLGDADLFDLAGDLFTDPAAPKLAPPDLAALGRTSGPTSARLLAPVALGAAPDRAVTPVAQPSTAPPVAAHTSEPPPRSRAFAPWVALPVAALLAAGVMVWMGRPGTAPTRTTGDQPTTTAPLPPPTTPSTEASAPASSPTTAPDAAEKPGPSKPSSDSTPTGPATAWKPPSSLAPTTTAPPTSPSAPPGPTQTAPPPASTAPEPPPAPTTPPPAGNEFNQSAAKAALRAAAGAAAGCPTEKPGVASVSITFAPSGRVTSSQVSGAFAGTTTGGCIASAMRSATVPAFDGGPVSVMWKVTLR